MERRPLIEVGSKWSKGEHIKHNMTLGKDKRTWKLFHNGRFKCLSTTQERRLSIFPLSLWLRADENTIAPELGDQSFELIMRQPR